MAEKITKGMMIMEVLQKFPKTGEVFMELGVHCVGCIAASGETIEQGLKAHGMDDKKIDEIIKKMNEKAK